MTIRLRRLLSAAADTFWILPGLMVLAGIGGALALVAVDRSGAVSDAWIQSPWLYSGGGTGARTLLGAVASSTIGVAGTVFSITIAALSLAAGQMGPRLLRNFVRDRGNQVTLGAFLGTFCYALMVLRTVRTQEEGRFVPYLALSVAILLAFLCVGTLVYFVGHMAGRINVDTVIDLVSTDVSRAMARLMVSAPPPASPPPAFWAGAVPVVGRARGYLQHLDAEALADWAAEHSVAIRLLVRPGDFLFPGAPIAMLTRPLQGAADRIHAAMATDGQRVSPEDIEYPVRQLVEVGSRALSAGINDPHTALSVLDRMGAALCEAAPLHLPSGVVLRNGVPALVVPATTYGGLVDGMFLLVRQDGAKSATVMIHAIDVLTAVASVERDAARQAVLQRHVDLMLADGEHGIANASDLEDLRARHRRFAKVRAQGAPALCEEMP